MKNEIIGNMIVSISLCEDYIQVFFINWSILNLYNVVKFSHDFQSFADEIVQDFALNENEMYIRGVNGKIITMSMKPEDYLSTEAFAFCSQNKEWIVD
jgi:hypothetical protein